MNRSKLVVRDRFPLSVLVFILGISLLFAGPTGKIVGRVVDAQTNEALVGCDVLVLGTEFGASVERDGRFSIINVPVGSYDVEASMVGYTPVVVKGVRVMADQVTVVNFKLSPTVIEEKPVEVVGERPMVVPSAVQTTRFSSAEDIARLPITQVTQLIGLSAGVVSRGGFQYIRGGRNDEIVTLVDGIAAVDPFYHIAYHRPPSGAVEEVQLITGGFDAEYGEAMSGVVQIATKEGGERFSGGVRWTSDDFMRKDLDFGYNLYQVNFGGPLLKRDARFFFSGELWSADDANPTRYRLKKPRQEYTGQGKISARLRKARLSLDYYTSCLQWNLFSNAWKYWLKRYGAVRSYGDKFGFVLNTMPDKNTVLEVRVGYHFYDRMQSVRDYSAEEGDKSHLLERLGIWQRYIMKSEDFVFRNERIPGHPIYDNKPAPPETAVLYLFKDERADWEEGTPYTTNNPWGVYGMFYGVGDYRLWHYRQSKTYIGKVDWTKQIGTPHEMKTGFEAKFYNLWLLENSLPWTSMPFWDAYRKKPYQFAYYLQDRANFEDLVIRAGLRFDFINPRSKKDATPYNVIDDSLVEAKRKFKISPRLGIAFPITERIKFRFSYGHFFQTPSFTNLYESLEADIVRRGNIIVGDPDLDAQKTIAYETGFEAQLSDVFAFDLTLFYKDIYDLVGTRPISALPMSYTILTNVEYGRTFGFELGFQKRLSQYWQARAGYTFQIAKGTAADAWQWYSYNYQGIPFTQIDYYLDYDQRHLFNFDFGLSFPRDYFFIPLRNFNSGLVFTYGTGFPYTPTDLRGTRTGDLNSGRMPASWNCDLRLSKEFRLGGIRPVLVCDVLNLFNHINVTNVHSATGLPNFDGQVYTVGQFTSGYIPGDPTYHPARDYDHDGYITQWERYDSYIQARRDYVDNPTNYGPPRRIRVGVEFGF